jgi:hypothetical protein
LFTNLFNVAFRVRVSNSFAKNKKGNEIHASSSLLVDFSSAAQSYYPLGRLAVMLRSHSNESLVPLQSDLYRNSSIPNDKINEIIFGSLLGDGFLELPPRAVNARFIFSQGIYNKEYFLRSCEENLYSIFSNCNIKFFNSKDYRSYNYFDKRKNKPYTTLSFKTKSLPILTEFYNMFYVGKEKTVPDSLELLTPIALAH